MPLTKRNPRHPDANHITNPRYRLPNSQPSLSRRLQDPSHPPTFKARTPTAESWTRSTTHTGRQSHCHRQQAHPRSWVVASKAGQGLLGPSSSQLDLLPLSLSEQSLQRLLHRRHCLQDSRQSQFLYKLRRAFSKVKPPSLERVLLFHLQALSPSPRVQQGIPRSRITDPRPTPAKAPRTHMSSPCAPRVQRDSLPQRGKSLILPCQSHNHRQKLPREPTLHSARTPFPDLNRRRWARRSW